MEKKINKIVRLKDIAEIAGISINSVSRALKGSPNISKETQKRVQEIAENLGYIPNIHAQSLKLGSIKVIAIIYDEVENPFYSMMLGILQQQLFEIGYEAMIFIDSRSYGHLSENIANKILKMCKKQGIECPKLLVPMDYRQLFYGLLSLYISNIVVLAHEEIGCNYKLEILGEV